MTEMNLDDVFRAAMKLPPDQQDVLLSRLQTLRSRPPRMTREQVLAEFERRKAAGAFDRVESMRNVLVNPAVNDLTDEELRSQLRGFSTEWEQELDDPSNDN
jgi:hypothetical protein